MCVRQIYREGTSTCGIYWLGWYGISCRKLPSYIKNNISFPFSFNKTVRKKEKMKINIFELLYKNVYSFSDFLYVCSFYPKNSLSHWVLIPISPSRALPSMDLTSFHLISPPKGSPSSIVP